MTIEQWNKLKVGDVLIDNHARGARRKIFSINRVSGGRGQRLGLTRTAMRVTNLKTERATTVIFETENTGPHRFDLAEGK